MRVRVIIDDDGQDPGDDAGFTGSCRADDTEMLAEQFVGQNVCGNGTLLMDGSDPRRGGVRTSIDFGKVTGGGQIDRLIERRISGYPAAKKAGGTLAVANLPNQFEFD